MATEAEVGSKKSADKSNNVGRDLDVIDIQNLGRAPVKEGHYREGTRRHLAMGMLIVLAVVMFLILAMTGFRLITADEAKELATALLSPLFGVFGAAIGFFFASSESQRR
jgi:hypothetical protein